MNKTAVASHWCLLEWAPLESLWYVKIVENEQLDTWCSLNHLIRIVCKNQLEESTTRTNYKNGEELVTRIDGGCE